MHDQDVGSVLGQSPRRSKAMTSPSEASSSTAPLMLVEVELESAETPSALSWSRGRGPDTSVEAGTPALARVTLEHRSPVSFVMPFVRWLGGLNR